MFVRLVYESFRRQKRRKLLAGAAITLGVTVATAMIAVATDIGDKINRELRTIGANTCRHSARRHTGRGNWRREPQAAERRRFSQRS